MGKLVDDTVLDGALNIIKNNCDEMTACATQPTNYTQAHTTNKLADVAMSSGDFTVANGSTSGRKVTVAQKTGVTVDTSGTADHVALNFTGSSVLQYVTTATSQALTAANTMTFNSWAIEIADPT